MTGNGAAGQGGAFVGSELLLPESGRMDAVRVEPPSTPRLVDLCVPVHEAEVRVDRGDVSQGLVQLHGYGADVAVVGVGVGVDVDQHDAGRIPDVGDLGLEVGHPARVQAEVVLLRVEIGRAH